MPPADRSALREFLSGPPPARPNAPDPRRPAAVALPLWRELVAELRPVFLRPRVDEALEAEARHAADTAPPGAEAEEALIVRGLLPENFDRSGRFVFMSSLTRNWNELLVGWVPAAADSVDDVFLPALAARWSLVSAGLDLLDEAAARLAPWGLRRTVHRVMLAQRRHAAIVLDSASANWERSILHKLGKRTLFFETNQARTYEEKVESVGHNTHAAATLSGHAMWRANAALGRHLPASHVRPPLSASQTFAETPNPFDPLVDILRLGLGFRNAAVDNGVTPLEAFMLVVPVPDAP